MGDGRGRTAGINDAGTIVGWSSTSNEYTAFVHYCEATRDLNELVVSANGWHLSEAHAVNAAGVIVGWGDRNGETRGFLLRPVP